MSNFTDTELTSRSLLHLVELKTFRAQVMIITKFLLIKIETNTAFATEYLIFVYYRYFCMLNHLLCKLNKE